MEGPHGSSIKIAAVESDNFKITAENFAELINMIATNEISTPAAKALLKKMFETGGDPSQLAESEGFVRQYSLTELADITRAVIQKNPQAVADYKDGKQNALQFLLGQMMAKTRGAISPDAAKEAILKEL